jgi:hypothetical protein
MIDTHLWRTQRLAALAAGCGLFAFGVHLGFYFAREPSFCELKSWGQSQPSPVRPSPSNPVNPACLAYPSLDPDVVIVVKTGATEALNRIPTQLLTFLSCAKDDVLIFSDMEQDIGGFHVYDALVIPRLRRISRCRTGSKDSQLRFRLIRNAEAGQAVW